MPEFHYQERLGFFLRMCTLHSPTVIVILILNTSSVKQLSSTYYLLLSSLQASIPCSISRCHPQRLLKGEPSAMKAIALGAEMLFLAVRATIQSTAMALQMVQIRGVRAREYWKTPSFFQWMMSSICLVLYLGSEWSLKSMEPQARFSKPNVCARWAGLLSRLISTDCCGTLNSYVSTLRFRCLDLQLNPTQGVQWLWLFWELEEQLLMVPVHLLLMSLLFSGAQRVLN